MRVCDLFVLLERESFVGVAMGKRKVMHTHNFDQSRDGDSSEWVCARGGKMKCGEASVV